MKTKLLIVVFLQFLFTNSKPQQPAFPGAEGFGKNSQGGRGGIVLHVTNLNDSGTGSLRWAISNYKGQKRVIVFDISGTIELQSTIEIKYDSYITIAGQTAPGDGICIKNFPIKVGDSHDIIFRYLRFRIGDEQDCGTGCDEIDALSFRKSYNIIVDHCSLGWSIDSVLDLTVSTGYSTVQWCLLHEPLDNSKHSKGGHSYIAGWDGSSYGGGTVFGGGSYHHNLLVSGGSRTPRLDKYAGDNGERDLIDIVNNVIYNWSGYGAYGGENADVNWQNNFYKYGPNTSRKNQIFLPGDTCRMYVNGNHVDGYPDVALDNSKGISATTLLSVDEILQDSPYNMWFIDMQTAGGAYQSVLAQAGAFVPRRDAVDARIVNDVVNRTGDIIDSPSEVGGWPVLNSSGAPTDTDKDGIPDQWEDKMGLDKNDAADRNNVAPNGYTQLEVYLNSIEFDKPVQNVKYTYNETGKISVTWDDIHIGEDSFKIERSINGGDFTELTVVPKNTISFIDTNDYQPGNIEYRVTAVQQGIASSGPSENIKASGIRFQLNDTIYAGDTINIDVLFEPINATNQMVHWEIQSQTNNIAEFINPDKLVAKAPGEFTLKASLNSDEGTTVSKNAVILQPVSVKQLDLAQVKLFDIYPNPSYTGYINVNFSGNLNENIQVSVCDLSGKVLYETIMENHGDQQLDYHFLKGYYLLHATFQGNELVKSFFVY